MSIPDNGSQLQEGTERGEGRGGGGLRIVLIFRY